MSSTLFEAAPDAVFSYDPQIRPGSIQRLPEPSREELLGLCEPRQHAAHEQGAELREPA